MENEKDIRILFVGFILGCIAIYLIFSPPSNYGKEEYTCEDCCRIDQINCNVDFSTYNLPKSMKGIELDCVLISEWMKIERYELPKFILDLTTGESINLSECEFNTSKTYTTCLGVRFTSYSSDEFTPISLSSKGVYFYRISNNEADKIKGVCW